MAATNETTNYGLPQWESTDKPERADFNQAMSDIDTNLNLVQTLLGLGGVEASGSNPNGDFVKLKNGTAIYHRRATIQTNSTSMQTFDMPDAFSSTYFGDMSYVTGTTQTDRLKAISTAAIRALAGSPGQWQVNVVDPTASAYDFEVVLVAIGRWKTYI